MKVNLAVEVGDADAEFFTKLQNGEYAWCSDATLWFAPPVGNPVSVDAAWILRATVSIEKP